LYVYSAAIIEVLNQIISFLPPHPLIMQVVFGTYMMVTLIVLINLLIAMMSDTYQRIQQQSDTEWKFGRAKLIRNMNKTSATPSPLNLFTKAYIYISVFFKYRGEASVGF
jgi:hypothetical protein